MLVYITGCTAKPSSLGSREVYVTSMRAQLFSVLKV